MTGCLKVFIRSSFDFEVMKRFAAMITDIHMLKLIIPPLMSSKVILSKKISYSDGTPEDVSFRA